MNTETEKPKEHNKHLGEVSDSNAFVMRDVSGFDFYDKAMLLSCPFCESTEMEFNYYLADGWVECTDCGCHGPHDYLAQVFREKCEGNAIDLWNDRPDA